MTETKEFKSMVGKKFRFVVSSAEEAVKVIRGQLGYNAKVLEVNQIGGKGLAKFISSPKLEIIATIPAPEALPDSEKKGEENNGKKEEALVEPKVDPEKTFKKVEEEHGFVDEGYKKIVQTARQQATPNNIEKTLLNVLEKVGFDSTLLTNLRSSEGWKNIRSGSLSHALLDVAEWLRGEYARINVRPLSKRVAFLGTPGSGKTTALCKAISKEVFIEQNRAQVMKLEGETPNPDDALRVFCDVLGVSLLRDRIDLEWIHENERLYLDLPGTSFGEKEENLSLKKRLDELNVDTRVLIVNSLYENDLIKTAFLLGSELGATHVVFSHIDELKNVAKLWPHLLRGGLTPLFLSHGQNLTADRTDQPLEFLITKTFGAAL